MTGQLLIDGAWVRGAGATFASHDPVDGEIVWQGAAAAPQDVDAACSAARKAFPAWARTPLAQRIAIARAFANIIKAKSEALAEIIARETGKVLWDARGEAATVVGKIEISIRAHEERTGQRTEGTAFGEARLDHRPHGVMAVFGPFNFPAHLPNGHITPALLAGNTLVFKPSELAPGAAELMVAAWEEAGLPAGVLNLVHGARETGAALLASPELNGVLFTGSAATGAFIHRQFAGRPDVVLALEMGGNNPLIAWPPASVEAAANLIVHSSFVSAGQRCSCARRLYAPDNAWGQTLIATLVAAAGKLRIGAWNADPEPFMGPLIHAHAAEQAERFVEDLVKCGGKVLAAPKRNGAFLHPTVVDMTGVEGPDEECFAPVLQVWRVASFDEGLTRANASRFGLSGGLVSDDPALWERALAELDVGILNWNRPTTGASGSMPFGGPGLSGSARPSAYYAADYCAYPVASQIAAKAVSIPAAGLP